MRIVAIADSLLVGSHNRRMLVEETRVAAPGVPVRIWEGLRQVPPCGENSEAEPPAGAAVARLREEIAVVDAVLIATLQDSGSVPGVLTNALDWASGPHAMNPLRDMPVIVVGGSPSPRGAAPALDELRRVLHVIGAEVVDPGLAVAPLPQRVDEGGAVQDGSLRARLRRVVARLAAHAAHTGEVPVALAG